MYMKRKIYSAPHIYLEEVFDNDSLTASLEDSDSDEERTPSMRDNIIDAFGSLLD